MDIITYIIRDVLMAIYHPFWFALVLTFFISICDMCASQKVETGKGYKRLIDVWISNIKESSQSRKKLGLTLYTVMILFQTLFNRNNWIYPVSNVIGVWGLYKFDSAKNAMVLTTEVPENLALFIPFIILLLWTYRDKIVHKMTLPNVLFQSIKIVFLFSFTIEFLQLFLRLGTWQLSDLFYNTLGGFIGGLLYYIGWKLASGKK